MKKITRDDYKILHEIFTEFDKKCKTVKDRSELNIQKWEKVNTYVKGIFERARECSDDAMYKSKVLGKDFLSNG